MKLKQKIQMNQIQINKKHLKNILKEKKKELLEKR